MQEFPSTDPDFREAGPPGIPPWAELTQWAKELLQSRFARGWPPADWEDMSQEAVLKVIIALEKKQVDLSRFNQWFPTVVRHVVIDTHRTRFGRHGKRTYEALPDERINTDAQTESKRTYEILSDEHTNTDEQTDPALASALAQRDVNALIERATELGPHERLVLDLIYWHGLDSAEVAQVIGKRTATTVRGWHQAALAKLRAHALKV